MGGWVGGEVGEGVARGFARTFCPQKILYTANLYIFSALLLVSDPLALLAAIENHCCPNEFGLQVLPAWKFDVSWLHISVTTTAVLLSQKWPQKQPQSI